MYIDKSKIIPALEQRKKTILELYMVTGDSLDRMDYLQIADVYERIINEIEMGMYDWQAGSE